METLSIPRTLMLVCAFAVANAMTAEDALAIQRLHENGPPELREVFQQFLQEPDLEEDEVFQQFLQEPDLDEDAEQVVGHLFRQPRNHHNVDENEEVEEKERTEQQEANDQDDAAENMVTEMILRQHLQQQHSDEDEEQELKDDEETSEDMDEKEETEEQEATDEDGAAEHLQEQDSDEDEEQEAKDEEETSEDMIPEMVIEEADSPGDDVPNVDEAMDDGMDFFGDPWADQIRALDTVNHFESPWAFVTDLVQSQGIPPDEVRELLTGMVDNVKEEFGEMPDAAKEMKAELPHVGEAGAKNTEVYDGEPLMIRDAEDDSAARIFSQRNLLQMNQFSFNGNVLNRPKNKEDDMAHWIVQFCPHWWDPCVGLTESFAKVGSELEEQLNGALFIKNIRFAIVDCASEKVLCNEQEVETYPTTRHYYKGEFVAGWFGGQAQHEKFYTQWLMQQAQGITSETPAGYVVGNLTNSAKGSKEKEEKDEIALPTLTEIAPDLLLVAVLSALCIRAVLSNVRLVQGANPQLEQQQQLPQQSESPQPQKSPNKNPHSERCRQRGTSQMPGAELCLPSSWNSPVNSMEL